MNNKIENQQQYVLDELKIQKEKIEPFVASLFKEFVWFQPESGRFLFDDRYLRYEIIEPLIQQKKLIYSGYKKHQGELMLQYSLNE